MGNLLSTPLAPLALCLSKHRGKIPIDKELQSAFKFTTHTHIHASIYIYTTRNMLLATL